MTTTPTRAEKVGEDSIKETFESIVIAFILAFVFRAYVVEAFVIPTGSMAPTLMGRHLRVTCTECGYMFRADPDENDLQEVVLEGGQRKLKQRSYITRPRPGMPQQLAAVCPMCHYPNTMARGTRVSPGDRILVHKYIYSISEPQRWDVVVFKAPHDPKTNYIKRLVGLPRERLCIVEGNIYVQPLDGPEGEAGGGAPGGAWQIARKPDRPEVQRAVWQPIYHSEYEPLDGGSDRGQHSWRQPWVAGDESAWQMKGRRGFRYSGEGDGVIRFDFARVREGWAGMYAYNHLKQYALQFESVEDVRLAVRVKPEGEGLSVSLSTTARLDDPQGRTQELVGRVTGDKAVLLAIDPETGQERTLVEPARVEPIGAGRGGVIELWYVDQEASLWLDGQRVLRWRFELPMEVVKTRERPWTMPQIAVAVGGGAATLYGVQVDRDLYYGSANATGDEARGGLLKSNHGYRGEPTELGADQFFCFGDNSPMSLDSRYWSQVNPWIHKRMFDGVDERDALGIVPRRLMIGRAFFVYFPSPLQWNPSSLPLIPNLGDMRFIH